MSREIKFRGKRVDDGEWVYGYYYKTIQRNGFSEEKETLWETHFIRTIDPIGIFEALEVKPETVGQFTGLKDKNGVKIFEGDILKSWYSRDMSSIDIVHTEQTVEYEIKQYSGEAGYEILFPEKCEVIGSIHENQ